MVPSWRGVSRASAADEAAAVGVFWACGVWAMVEVGEAVGETEAAGVGEWVADGWVGVGVTDSRACTGTAPRSRKG